MNGNQSLLVRIGHIFALLIAIMAAGTVGLVLPAAASPTSASPWAKTDHGAVRLLTGVVGTGSAEQTPATAPNSTEVPLGLEFRLAPGWKIYWRSPGDAGYAPAIDWSGSENLAATSISWPVPTRFSILGFETVGYEDDVILPIAAHVERAGEPLVLDASVDYLTCKEICVPHVAKIALTVPAGPATPSNFAPVIDAARASVPGAPAEGEPRIDSLVLEAAGNGQAAVRMVARSKTAFTAPDVFVEGPRELTFGAPQVRLADGGHTAVLDVPVYNLADLGRPLVGETLTVTLRDATGAVEQHIKVADAIAKPPATISSPPLLLMIAIAWLGGLILNLMPCVLPVLSIKLLGVVAHGGADRATIRLGFLASAAGILVSFWAIAAALLMLKAAGAGVGWGLQFQEPWFLVAMTLIVAVFACNLWGWFEVPLPRLIADAGAAASHVRGLGGQFLTGALATLLATPCTAPFVGTAIGFALGGDTATAVAVFTAMAIGLATPYLAVAAVPQLAQRLPRPGRWMMTVRRVLAVVLLMTGAWLLSILAVHIGTPATLAVGGLAVLFIAMIAMGPRLKPLWRRAAAFAAAAAAVAALVLPTAVFQTTGGVSSAGVADRWVPFEPERIPALVAAGKTVLVNVTADWCLTCKVNERVVLARPPVRDRLAEPNVIVMQGDWTRPDDAITRYLASFGRYGIPFDAVYGPGSPRGEALPELLTADVVISAIDRAVAPGTVTAAKAATGVEAPAANR